MITIEPTAELRCRAPAQLVDGGPQTTLPVVPGWIRPELASTVLGCRRRAMRDDVQQLQVQLEHLLGIDAWEARIVSAGVGLPLFDFHFDLNQSDGWTASKRRLLAVYLPRVMEARRYASSKSGSWPRYYNLMNAGNIWLKLTRSGVQIFGGNRPPTYRHRESPALETTKRGSKRGRDAVRVWRCTFKV
ncbi:hypothetical protein DFH09DRAFT_1082269 [Mycena vulgaris]|nr:hypothetical protein DFH09DRAFT_1082269 [Mycena vulgaris]